MIVVGLGFSHGTFKPKDGGSELPYDNITFYGTVEFGSGEVRGYFNEWCGKQVYSRKVPRKFVDEQLSSWLSPGTGNDRYAALLGMDLDFLERNERLAMIVVK